MAGIDFSDLTSFISLFSAFKGADIEKKFKDDLPKYIDAMVSEMQDKIPKDTGAAEESIKAGSDYITAGGDDAPYYGWLDFGGTRIGNGGGEALRDYMRKGRFLYPSILDHMSEMQNGAADGAEGGLGAAGGFSKT